MLQVACTVAQSIFSKLNSMSCNHNCRRVQNFNGLLILYIVLLNSAEPRLDRAHRCTTYDLVAVITHHGSVGGIVSVINEFVVFFVLFVCLFVLQYDVKMQTPEKLFNNVLTTTKCVCVGGGGLFSLMFQTEPTILCKMVETLI